LSRELVDYIVRTNSTRDSSMLTAKGKYGLKALIHFADIPEPEPVLGPQRLALRGT
jgi:hypothetical protein